VSAAAAAAADQPDVSPEVSAMSIGEVLARLREDFPDITISKLRFLEAEGLVEPKRTSAGYRKYTAGDVARLGFVLAAQRDRFLPLRVIRDQLAAFDRGESVDYDTSTRRGDLSAVGRSAVDDDFEAGKTLLAESMTGPMRREEVLAQTGLTDAELRELEDAGLIRSRSPGWYAEDAFIIAVAAARLAQHGIGVRHLRAYRTTADREVGLFAALVTPLAKSASASARSRAVETIRELTALSQQLHAALVREGLRDTLGL
jgi:DNA-binding transcriptional MerR regulator